MTIGAPRIDLTKPADAWLHIADISAADKDLTTQAGCGQFAAQLVRLNNATTAALTAILIPEQTIGGVVSQAIVVNAGQQYEVPIPIKKIVASGSGALSADVFWWHGNSNQINRS
jgi:hypothetical protein